MNKKTLITLTAAVLALGALQTHAMQEMVSLQTNDGKIIQAPREITEIFDTIEAWVGQHGVNEAIPLSQVNSENLQTILDLVKLFPYEKVSYKGHKDWRTSSLKLKPNLDDSRKELYRAMEVYDESNKANMKLSEVMDKYDTNKMVSITNAAGYLGVPIVYNMGVMMLGNRIEKLDAASLQLIIQKINEKTLRNKVMYHIAAKMAFELERNEPTFLAMTHEQADNVWEAITEFGFKNIDNFNNLSDEEKEARKNAVTRIKEILKLK